MDVDLPRPRTDDSRETRRYFELVTEVREALRAGGRGSDDDPAVDDDRVDRADDGRGRGRVSVAVGPLSSPAAAAAPAGRPVRPARPLASYIRR